MMILKKVFSIFVAAVMTIQLCDSNEIKTENNYSNDVMDRPSDVSNVTEKINLTGSTTVTPTLSDIKIDDQKFNKKPSGEYKHE